MLEHRTGRLLTRADESRAGVVAGAPAGAFVRAASENRAISASVYRYRYLWSDTLYPQERTFCGRSGMSEKRR